MSCLETFRFVCRFYISFIIVFTDHNALTFINKMQNKNKRLTRWALYLQEYHLKATVMSQLMICLELDKIVMNLYRNILQKFVSNLFFWRANVMYI
jgi:hypothetical protein